MIDRWLNCRIGPGMFSDEYTVTVEPKLSKGTEVRSLFVEKGLVEPMNGDGSKGRVRVQVFRRDATLWAILPTEDQLAIPVDEVDLVAT